MAVDAMAHANGDRGLPCPPRRWALRAVLGRPVTPGPTLPGLFVYPLDEYTTVIGFEAVIADRVVTVQIKDKAKIEGGHVEAAGIRAATVTGKRAGRLWQDLGAAGVSGRPKGSSGIGQGEHRARSRESCVTVAQ